MYKVPIFLVIGKGCHQQTEDGGSEKADTTLLRLVISVLVGIFFFFFSQVQASAFVWVASHPQLVVIGGPPFPLFYPV